MSSHALAATWRLNNITPLQKLILLALAEYEQKATSISWPGLTRLEAMTGLTKQSLRINIKRLEDEGLVTRISRFTPSGKQTSNAFQLNYLGEAEDNCRGVTRSLGSDEVTPSPRDEVTPSPPYNKNLLTKNLDRKNFGLLSLGEEPSTIKTIPTKSIQDIETDFLQFWNVYPSRLTDSGKSKGSKGKALQSYIKLVQGAPKASPLQKIPALPVLLKIAERL